MRRLLSTYFLCTRGGGKSQGYLPRNNRGGFRRDGFIIRDPRRCQISSSISFRPSRASSFSDHDLKIPPGHSHVLHSPSPLFPPFSPFSPPFRRSKNLGIDTQGSEFPPGDRMRHPSAFTYDYAIRYHAREQAPSRRYTVHVTYVAYSTFACDGANVRLAPR